MGFHMKPGSNVITLGHALTGLDEIILIPEGDYSLKFIGWRTWMYFGRQPKVVLDFAVVDMGPYFEVPLQRYYNAQRLIGRKGKNGGFKVGRSSDFLREFALVSNRPVRRLDRIPMTEYENSIIIGRVSTVKKSRNQKEIPELVQYSVISEIRGVIR